MKNLLREREINGGTITYWINSNNENAKLPNRGTMLTEIEFIFDFFYVWFVDEKFNNLIDMRLKMNVFSRFMRSLCSMLRFLRFISFVEDSSQAIGISRQPKQMFVNHSLLETNIENYENLLDHLLKIYCILVYCSLVRKLFVIYFTPIRVSRN